MPTNPANIYCSADDMADILSEVGVNLRTDDTPPSTLGGVIAKASNRVDFFLFRRYAPDQLAQSDFIKDCAAVLACHYLCLRRGNPMPPGMAELLAEVMTDLLELKQGKAEIPGVPARKSYVPVISIMRATQRPYNRAVVEKSRGSQATGVAENYRQHVDPWERFGGNQNAYLDFSI